ncbi:MAG TPA: hypothetical protein VFS49_01400 [Croceibacterium sp.]|nr:hypothetical protein [Croceibacterium sp.]
MQGRQDRLGRRIQSIQYRIESLPKLRKLVMLSSEADITERQWAVIEPQLVASSARLTARLRRAGEDLLPKAADRGPARSLNSALGQIELDMSRAFTFFDTYMDVLTQRHAPVLGGVLAGCDVLALEAMRRDHPALAIIEPPLVYCERGIGAAIARESVPFPDGSMNPMPLIQIPYARLSEKYNLTSLLHEAGHQALARLQLVGVLPKLVEDALGAAGASPTTSQLFALWMSEIAPDFWAFGLTGVAEAAAVCELFAMPSAQALRIAPGDPHPPPYLRALLCFDWCRRAWGMGPWDEWERDWLDAYVLDAVPPETRRLLVEARRYIPVVSHALFDGRFSGLGGRRLLDLLDLPAVAPARLEQIAGLAIRRIELKGLTPCAQLAAFRMIRVWRKVSEQRLDELMTEWLVKLGRGRRLLN